MKKFLKKVVIVLLIIGLMGSDASLFKIKAATSLFTLGAIPVVNREVAGVNSVNVSNITQYIDAINNPAVDVINFTTNITAVSIGQAMGLSVNRDLLINGNGFTLTIIGNSNFGPNSSGIPAGTHLMLGGTGGTLHLKNLTLNRGTSGGGQNDFISVMTGTNETWDMIFDDFICIYETNQWNSVVRVAQGTLNSTRIFLRNNSNLRLPSSGAVFVTNGPVVSEENSTVNLTGRANAAIFGIPGSDTRFYVSPGSNTTLGLPPQTNMGNRGTLASVREVNVYPTASLNLTGAGNAAVSALTSVNSTTEMVLRIDRDAYLKVENTAGPAIISTGSFPVRILGNPDSTVEIFGSGSPTTAQMTLTGSEISLSNPKYYNIQNNGTGAAFSGVGASTPTLRLTETNVASWLLGQSVAGNPQTPSPFANVDLITGSTVALAGSSPIVDTMAGGWNTANYRRISYANVVEITAADMTIGLGRSQGVNPQVVPPDATLTYTSNNPSIATVDASGNVTGVVAGTTTITISGTSGAGFFPGSTTINVTVTNNPPSLVVPEFTEVPLNGDFDPKTGVTATDVEDGNLINSVQVTNPVNTSVPGIYVVNYSLIDFNNNIVTAKQVVLVQDNNFVVGTNTIIKASDFTKRIGEVDTTPAAIKTAAGVKVYSKATGAELVNEPVTITEDNGYSSTVNTYPITFVVDQDAAATITIDGSVVTGDAPVLTVNPAFVEVSLNGIFDASAGVTATDSEDGTITNIDKDNPVNTAVAGVYVVTYTVTDTDGNQATKTRTVLVQDNNFVVGTNTIIKAVDFTKRPSQVDTTPAAIKAAAGVKVYNKATGAELVNEPVTITEDSGYSSIVNDYPITFVVDQDANATITIDASVVTGGIPVLIVNPAFVEVPLNGTFNERAGLSSIDGEDGVITDDIDVDNTVDTSVPGVYVVTYTSIDVDGNTATSKRVVLVNDGTFQAGATHIVQGQDFTKRVGQVDTSDTAIKTAANIKVYNKTTGLEDTVTGVTFTDKDGYTSAVGDYNIAFQVNGDNTAQRTIVASVVAGLPPDLSVPAFTEVALDGIFYPETGVTATDPEDGNLIDEILIDGSVDTSVAGIYILNYSVTDPDGNSATATQVVLVNDGKYQTGDTYILHGEDFEKTFGQVDTTPAAIKSAAKVKVYSKATGLETNTPTVNIKDDGGYTQALGSYNITFEIVEDTLAEVTIVGKVITGEPPVLTVPAFAEISVNDTFNPLLGVTATDPEDGDLISKPGFVYTNHVNVAVAGVYTVEYSLTDSDSNTVTAEQVVLVNDGNYSAGTANILFAKDFTNRISQVDTSAAAIKLDAEAKIYSKITGVFIASATINVVDKGGYDAVEGTYDIVLEIGGDTATRTVKAKVIPGSPPELTVPAFAEVSKGGSFDETAGVSATDDEDGPFLIGDIDISGSVDVNTAGIYTLTYSVTDSDGNTTTDTQVVLVNDDTFVAGATTILQAESFTKRVGEVDTTPSAIKTAAGVKVYNKATGAELVDEPVTVTEDSGYGPLVDTYPITFVVDQDATATITIDASVVTGSSPVLTVNPAFVEVPLNGSFDAAVGVTATDTEDGTITDIAKDNPVNTAVAGVYVVTYTVTDSDGNQASKTRTVLVQDNNFVVGTNTIIKAVDFSKRPSEVDTTPSAIKAAAGVKVYDKLTGAELVNEPVTITEDSGYSSTVGTYPITFKVDQEATATITIDASVVTGGIPVLVVNPAFVEVALNGTFDENAGVSAIDSEDGDITDEIDIDNTVNISLPGVYAVTYTITDTDGNQVSKIRTVLVQDNNFVVGSNTIIEAVDFSKRPSEVDITPSAIKAAAGVKVYDKLTGEELVNEPVTITEDSGYSSTVNTYPITFEVDRDATATITIDASVVTGEIPVLTVNPAFVEVALNGVFDENAGVSAVDSEDGIITDDIDIDNTVDTSVAGVYAVTYTITDTDGNQVSKIRTVLVQDNSFVVGTDTIIEAVDFSKRPSEVDTTPSAIKAAAGVKVYDKLTGEELVNEPVTITEDSGYSSTVNTYPITFEVDRDATATITIDASVVTGEIPVLTVNPAFVEVALDGTFDENAGVSAVDSEDGIITDDIDIDNTVDTSVAGVYAVTYTITDTDGNQVSKIRTVLVQDNSLVVGTNTIIKASDFSKRPSEVDTTPSAIKEAAGVKVYDKLTGEELVNEPVTITEDSGYSSTINTYPITFEVDQDAAATITIDASVVEGGIPVLTVNPAFVEVALNGVFDENAGVSAVDSEDGVITDDIDIDNTVDTDVAGVYAVTYTITDTDGNQVSKIRTVLVQDNSFVVGTDTIIEAVDFTKRPSEVDTTPSAIKAAAGVKVYDKLTGEELVNEPVTITEDSGYSSTVNTYPITFEVDRDATATITIDASVVTGGIPVLTVNPEFKEVPLNGSFNVMNGVTSIDQEDGDITEDIDIDDTVDTSVAGVYAITYTTTDTDGNQVSKIRTVLVQDGTLVVGTNTIIQASDFMKRPSEVDTTPSVIKTAAGVKVYDKATGVELVNEPVTITEDSGYSSIVNIYPITFQVDQDATAMITIDAHVVTGEAPELVVPDLTEVPLNGTFDPRTNVSATDFEDGSLTGSINIDEDTVNTSAVGVYHVKYSVTDADGNRANATQIVVVSDGEMTVGDNTILFATDFQKRVGEVDTSAAAIRAAANVKVYDRTTGQEIPGAVVNIVDLGNYHGAVGTYPITFEVSGDSQSRKTINATVVAGDSPVLFVPAFRETTVNSNFDLLTGVTATDTEDIDLIDEVSIVGDFDNAVPGVYTLQYSVVDSDGNRVSAEGVILVNNGEFNVGEDTIIQASDFVKRISEVDTSDAAVIEAANVKLYDKVSGKEIENPQIRVDDLGGYQGVAGNYTIKFSATNDILATKSIIGTVVGGEFPVIVAPPFTEVLEGGSFNPMTGVTVTDAEDANIEDDLIVTDNVDTSKPGVYTVHYEVTDQDGNRTETTQVVLVQNGKYFAGDSNILYAEDFEKRVSQVDLSETAILAAAKVRVFDKTTGEELTVADVTIGDLGGYQAVPDIYNITFEVINDASTNITIQATVAQGEPPVLEVPALTEVPINGSFDATTGVVATDAEDGDISHLVQVSGTVDVNTVGIYTLNYSVTDKDGNTVTAQQIVLVSDGELIVGESTIIYADDFTKRVGQVDTSDAAIKTAANVRVYDKDTGLLLPLEPVNIVNKGGYGPTVGSYPITFEVASDIAARTTIVGKVITGSKPVLTVAPAFMEVTLNSIFDPSIGVTSIDLEDGPITGSIITGGAVNTSVAGVYPITYTTIDSDFNRVTKTRVVLVVDDSFTVGDTTILEANDFTKRVGQVDTSPAAIKTAAGVTVYDKLTGQILPDEPVNIVNTGGYGPAVDSYQVTLQVVSDGLATSTITASVVTGDLPVLIVDPAFMEVTLNGNFNPETGVSATDAEDGPLTTEVQVAGSVDTTIAGVYTLTYTITDSDENEVSLKRVVLVNDGQANVGDDFIMTGKAFTKRLSEVDLTESTIKEAAQVRVFDKVTGIEIFTNTITIVDLGGYEAVPGTYNITFGIEEDPSVELTIEGTVLTDTPPQLDVPNFTEIPLNGSFNPKAGVSATDVEDGDISDIINVQGQVDVSKAGIYTISYDVTDSDNNKVTAVQTVLVNDGNFNYANGYIIQGNDFRIGLSKANLSDVDMIALAGIRVFDLETQTWVSNPLIRVDRGDFAAKVGDYTITFIFNPNISVKVSVYQDTIRLPKSGDGSQALGFGLILSLAGSALVAMYRRKLKKKS